MTSFVCRRAAVRFVFLPHVSMGYVRYNFLKWFHDNLSLHIHYEVLKVFFDFSLTVKAAPHENVIRTGQP